MSAPAKDIEWRMADGYYAEREPPELDPDPLFRDTQARLAELQQCVDDLQADGERLADMLERAATYAEWVAASRGFQERRRKRAAADAAVLRSMVP